MATGLALGSEDGSAVARVDLESTFIPGAQSLRLTLVATRLKHRQA